MSYYSDQLAYCSNVHPGETLAGVKRNVEQFVAKVGGQRRVNSMASGLWLSADAAQQLQSPEALEAFKLCLQQANVRLTSLNGFPYGDFHQAKVKAEVYLPDWADVRRLEYSKQLGRILAACLPDDCDLGVISTLPLGYQADWNDNKQALADEQLRQLAAFLSDLKVQTGKQIVFGLEMEPDCVLESTPELIRYFVSTLQGFAGCREHLQLCYDVCHQAVMYENAFESLEQIIDADIGIGKIQLSNALVANFEHDGQDMLALLADFCEPKYLHQVKSQTPSGPLLACADLTTALATASELTDQSQWRIHFHVPLNASYLAHPQLQTTQAELLRVFDFLAEYPHLRPYLEVETYSWNVLPQGLRPMDDQGLIDSIVAELDWVEQQLKQRGLWADEARTNE